MVTALCLKGSTRSETNFTLIAVEGIFVFNDNKLCRSLFSHSHRFISICKHVNTYGICVDLLCLFKCQIAVTLYYSADSNDTWSETVPSSGLFLAAFAFLYLGN